MGKLSLICFSESSVIVPLHFVAEISVLLISGGSDQKDIRVRVTAEESWERTW